MKRKFVFSFMICLGMLCINARALTWSTIGNGNWNDSSIWSGGVPPAYSFIDTIYIRHTVYFNNHIILNPGAYMQIDSLRGFLCGHYNMTTYSGTCLTKYGSLHI